MLVMDVGLNLTTAIVFRWQFPPLLSGAHTWASFQGAQLFYMPISLAAVGSMKENTTENVFYSTSITEHPLHAGDSMLTKQTGFLHFGGDLIIVWGRRQNK